MNTVDVLMVRVYITESSHLLADTLSWLKKDAGIRGVSVFRAISGFGSTGEHAASLTDLSLDLPLVIEFFDSDREKINKACDHLAGILKSFHITVWEAKANL